MIPNKLKVKEAAMALHPSRPLFNEVEFECDYSNLNKAKRIASRFLSDNSINARLMINYLTIAVNVWGSAFVTRALNYLCDDAQFSVIKSGLLYIGCYHSLSGRSVASCVAMDNLLKNEKRK